MFGNRVSRNVLMAMAMMGAISSTAAHAVGVDNSGWKTPRLIGGNGEPWTGGSYPRADRSKTAAQQKRASQKRKNVKRHRRHVRG